MSSKELSERSFDLLKTLVSKYIRDGLPVGSKTLSGENSISLSPATIRNIMAELEEAGYIRSPHKSAGRIPTNSGYRLFVDSLVSASETQDSPLVDLLKGHLSKNLSSKALAESASNLLSNITQQAGLVLLPKNNNLSFRHLEFLPLSGCRILVIFVLDEHEVQNRIIQTNRDYSKIELQKASAFINQNYSGKELSLVRDGLIKSMRDDKSIINSLMQSAIDFTSKALKDISTQAEYLVAGQENLLSNEVYDLKQIKDLFDAFQQKKDIAHLMERCIHGDGLQIFIGQESGYEVLDDFSLVTAPYYQPSEAIGVLGVIGPTRMAYQRIVPIVDITAKLLSTKTKN